MYCPRCGEEQSSDNLRFCSKCGLPIGLVSEVLSNGGTLPQLEGLYNKKSEIITKRNGMIFSLFWMIFFVLILTPFWGIMHIDELAGMSAIIGIFGGLMILLFSKFFLQNPSQDLDMKASFNQSVPQNLSGQQTQQNALPSKQTQAAQDFVAPSASSWKTYDTGDLVQPGSVTEGTTKLLKKELQEE